MRFLEGSLRSSTDGRPRQRTASRELRNFGRLDWPASPHHRGLSSSNRTRLCENAGNLTYPLAVIQDPEAIRAILKCLNLPPRPPPLARKARAERAQAGLRRASRLLQLSQSHPTRHHLPLRRHRCNTPSPQPAGPTAQLAAPLEIARLGALHPQLPRPVFVW